MAALAERAEGWMQVGGLALTGLAGRLASRRPPWPGLALTTPEGLLATPVPVCRGDPGRGAELYAGRFALARILVEVGGRSVFAVTPPTREWAAALHGFCWLADLAAADSALARLYARALIDQWLGRRRPRVARQPEVTAHRLTAWLAHAPFVLDGTDAAFRRRFLRALAADLRHLRRSAGRAPRGVPRLTAAAALALGGLALAGQQRSLRAGFARLEAELAAQILPDGGHASRDPAALIEALIHLLPLKQACIDRQVPPPAALLGAFDRMLPMLRALRHDDGAFALFNGMGATPAAQVAAILAHDDAGGRPLLNAAHSGYQRLEGGGGMLVLVDVGAPPPPALAAAAHAGTLSFELSVGRERIVVNCGAAPPRGDLWRLAARATAAHSTLGIIDASSARFVRGRLQRLVGPLMIGGPRNVTATRADTPEATRIRASHDGYAARFGVVHERSLVLDAAGTALCGTDRLRPAPGRRLADAAVAARFHLHLDVRASLVRDGHAVLLTAPSGLTLLFEAENAQPSLQESVHLADPMGPRRTAQIVLAARSRDTALSWRFTRVTAN